MLLKRLLAVSSLVGVPRQTLEMSAAIVWALAFLCLGYIGFKEYFESAGLQPTFADNLYNALALFVWDFNAPPVSPAVAKTLELPLALEAARWGAPILLLYAAGKTFVTLLNTEINQFRMAGRKQHRVVVGLNSFTLPLIQQFITDTASARTRVSLVVRDINNPLLASIQKQGGVRVLIDPAMGPDILKKVAAHRADRCLFCSESDETNLVLLESLYADYKKRCEQAKSQHKVWIWLQTLTGKKEQKQTCIVEVMSPQLTEVMYQNEAIRQDYDGFSARVINRHKVTARALVAEYPPDNLLDGLLASDHFKPPLRILLMGESTYIEFLVLQLLQMCHFGWDQPHTIFWMDENAESLCQRFKLENPAFDQFCQLESVELPLDLRQRSQLEQHFKDQKPDIAYLISDSYLKLKSLTGALQVMERPCPVVVADLSGRLEIETSKGTQPGQDHPILLFKHSAAFHQDVIDEQSDVLARQLHEEYLNSKRNKDGTLPVGDDAVKKWDELPETLKDSNRLLADHLGTKKRIFERLGVDTTNPKFLDGLSADIREQVAAAEHRRWLSEKLLSGWKRGDSKNTNLRINTQIKPWEELSDDEKSYNLGAMINGLPEQWQKQENLKQPISATKNVVDKQTAQGE